MKGILIDENGDLMVRNGAPVIGDCAADIAERVIRAWQGEFKEEPLIGGNICKVLKGSPSPFWRDDLKKQMKSQHIELKELNIENNKLELIIK
jgi:hypothetical protein